MSLHQRTSRLDPNQTQELAQRANDGVEIRLLWNRGDGRLTITVVDSRTGESFDLVAESGKEALDAFHHPFAYAAARGVAYGADTLEPVSAAPTPSRA
jgi:hypothetical protein